MAGKTRIGVIPQPLWVSQVLGLLRRLVVTEHATLSIYTSRKGRTWVNFKTVTPHVWGTACELPRDADVLTLLRTLGVCAWAHLGTLHGYGAQSDSWLPLGEVDAAWDDVIAAMSSQEELDVDISTGELVDEPGETDDTLAPPSNEGPAQPEIDTTGSNQGKATRTRRPK